MRARDGELGVEDREARRARLHRCEARELGARGRPVAAAEEALQARVRARVAADELLGEPIALGDVPALERAVQRRAERTAGVGHARAHGGDHGLDLIVPAARREQIDEREREGQHLGVVVHALAQHRDGLAHAAVVGLEAGRLDHRVPRLGIALARLGHETQGVVARDGLGAQRITEGDARGEHEHRARRGVRVDRAESLARGHPVRARHRARHVEVVRDGVRLARRGVVEREVRGLVAVEEAEEEDRVRVSRRDLREEAVLARGELDGVERRAADGLDPAIDARDGAIVDEELHRVGRLEADRVGARARHAEGALRVGRARAADGAVLAVLDVRLACVGLADGKPTRWPATVKEALSRHILVTKP